ncbi:MAG: hypothetical protein NT038_01110 [Euryarchaeota archaeon]|nr:hypothetical protein [Euryarchaeota archaeon]
MKRMHIIGISVVSVLIIILASLINVVGYQTVQSTNQITINNEGNQRELLFQTIADIANNKEIQQIILKFQVSRKGLFYPNEKFPTLNTPPVTKNQIKNLYFIGLFFIKVISKSKMQSMLEKYQFNNPEIQQELSTIIEKNATLNREVKQLSSSECGCDNEQTPTFGLPVLCTILLSFFSFIFFLLIINGVAFFIALMMGWIEF